MIPKMPPWHMKTRTKTSGLPRLWITFGTFCLSDRRVCPGLIVALKSYGQYFASSIANGMPLVKLQLENGGEVELGMAVQVHESSKLVAEYSRVQRGPFLYCCFLVNSIQATRIKGLSATRSVQQAQVQPEICPGTQLELRIWQAGSLSPTPQLQACIWSTKSFLWDFSITLGAVCVCVQTSCTPT